MKTLTGLTYCHQPQDLCILVFTVSQIYPFIFISITLSKTHCLLTQCPSASESIYYNWKDIMVQWLVSCSVASTTQTDGGREVASWSTCVSLTSVRQKTQRNLQLAGKLTQGSRGYRGQVCPRTGHCSHSCLLFWVWFVLGKIKEKEGERENSWLLKSIDFAGTV